LRNHFKFALNDEASACLTQVTQLPPGNVSQLTHDVNTQQLILTVDSDLLALPIAHCQLYDAEKQCLETPDPHCGFNQTFID